MILHRFSLCRPQSCSQKLSHRQIWLQHWRMFARTPTGQHQQQHVIHEVADALEQHIVQHAAALRNRRFDAVKTNALMSFRSSQAVSTCMHGREEGNLGHRNDWFQKVSYVGSRLRPHPYDGIQLVAHTLNKTNRQLIMRSVPVLNSCSSQTQQQESIGRI